MTIEIDETTGLPVLSDYDRGQREALISGLRGLADFYESRPNLPAAYCTDAIIWAHSKAELAALIRAAGSLDKSGNAANDGTLRLRKRFSDMIEFRVVADKSDTCQRVLVETKKLPAEEEKTVTIPAKPARVEEVYRWECPESLLRPEAESEANNAE